jgi:hypothetical protein
VGIVQHLSHFIASFRGVPDGLLNILWIEGVSHIVIVGPHRFKVAMSLSCPRYCRRGSRLDVCVIAVHGSLALLPDYLEDDGMKKSSNQEEEH